MLQQTDNLYDNNSGKIMHKIIMVFVALAIAVVCYSVTVYAWYQDSITNNSNSITVGTFSAEVQILDENDTVLWDSTSNFPDGILGFDDTISLPAGTKPVSIKIASPDSDSINFQYQILIEAENSTICSAGIAEKKVLAKNGWESFDITFPDSATNFTEIHLKLRTSFENGIINNPLTLNLLLVQPSQNSTQTPAGSDQGSTQTPAGGDQGSTQTPAGSDQGSTQTPAGGTQAD